MKARENLKGLKAMKAFDTARDLEIFDLKITPVREAVKRALEEGVGSLS